jgi:PAS domain-containing protein
MRIGIYMTKSSNMQAIPESSPVGMLVFDENEEVLFANRAACNIFDMQHDPHKSYRCGDFISCANRERAPKGCGYSQHCAECSILASLRTVLSRDDKIGLLEGETKITTTGRPIRNPLNAFTIIRSLA